MINRLAASRDFEIEKSKEQMERERVEKESKMRQDLEEKFCQEKKDLQSRACTLKRMKLREVMDKDKDDSVM